MNSLTENKYSIAWFIRQCLENAFRGIDKERVLREAENGGISNQVLPNLAFRLTAFLYNAGYTSSIISPGSIRIKLHNQSLTVAINNVGVFVLDIKGDHFDAGTWKEPVINEEAPIPLNEAAVNPAAKKQQLQGIPAKLEQHKDLIKLF